MAKLLFVVRSFSQGGAQPLRFQKIIENIKERHTIHIIEFSNKQEQTINENGITIHRLKYSFWGSVFNGAKNNSSSNKSADQKHYPNFYKTILLSVFRFLKKFFFPDTFITEYKKLKKEVVFLLKENEFDAIIVSAFPFTTLKLSKEIKDNRVLFIYDIGDPFYKNAKNNLIKNFFAFLYEYKYLKNIGALVVTNEPTRNLYAHTYSKPLNGKKIYVVEQGVDINENKLSKIRGLNQNVLTDKKVVKLIYAGQFYNRLREPFNLFEAIYQINRENSNLLFLDVYGSISKRFFPKIESAQIKFHGKISYNDVLLNFSRSDIVIFIDNAYGFQTPGKIFEVIASNKPVLFISDNKNSCVLSLANKYNNIYKCKNSIEDIIVKLNEIINNRKVEEFNHDFSEFSWENRSLSFEEIIIEKTCASK